MTWLLLRKFGPYIVIALLFAALMQTRSTLHNVRMNDKLTAAQQATAIEQSKAAWALDGKKAAEMYAQALADRQPIIVRSINEVTRYAETPAGRVPCAAPDRVRGIDALDASLWPSDTSPSGRGTLPADARPSATGR